MNTDKANVWILEDDPECVFIYDELLSPLFSTRTFASFSEFQATFTSSTLKNQSPHLLIIDLNLKDGYFLDKLRDKESDALLKTPFIIVSADDTLDTLRTCFAKGALDYLTKPFRKNELLAKVEHALYLASKTQNQKSLPLNQLRDGLTKKELYILETFLKSPNCIASRIDLENSLWRGVTVHSKALDVHMYNLRKKLLDLDVKIVFLGKGQWQLTGEGLKNLLI